MSLTVAWKWRLCAPGLTILWGSLTCLGCGLPVSVVPQGPTSRTADAEWVPGLSHYQGWRAVFASSRGGCQVTVGDTYHPGDSSRGLQNPEGPQREMYLPTVRKPR